MNSLVFNSKKAAFEFLSSVEGLSESNNGQYFFQAGIYHLSYGEYSQPDYAPRRYKDGWSIHVTYYYYAGTCYAPHDGRVDPETFFNRFS